LWNPANKKSFIPKTEVGHEIEMTHRDPMVVGRVTPCAPRQQPAGANIPGRRLPNPLPIRAFSGFVLPTSEFGFKAGPCNLVAPSLIRPSATFSQPMGEY